MSGDGEKKLDEGATERWVGLFKREEFKNKNIDTNMESFRSLREIINSFPENVDDETNSFVVIREYKNQKDRVLVDLKKYQVKIID